MDTKANQNARKKLNELAVQHNKLTTLVACLLNEIGALKKEVIELKGGDGNSNRLSGNDNSSRGQSSSSKFPNFNDLRAEDILKQLSINNSDN